MLKLILQLGAIYLVLQYGFKVDINGYVKPYIQPLWQEAQDKLPSEAETLLEKAQPLSEAIGNSDVAKFVKDRATVLEDAKVSVEELEQKMKELKEAADEATEGNN